MSGKPLKQPSKSLTGSISPLIMPGSKVNWGLCRRQQPKT
jgi:hypothetical protein